MGKIAVDLISTICDYNKVERERGYIMFIADLVITFENGSTGAKQFQSYDKNIALDSAVEWTTRVVQYAKAKQKNLVKSHRVSVKEVK